MTDLNIRLTKQEVVGIKSVILTKDPKCNVYLFGSRCDLFAKGGDIDLLLESECLTIQDIRSIKIALIDILGEQKIDILIRSDVGGEFLAIIDQTKVLL